MPQTVLTVFLSSTAADLTPYREAVFERLRPIHFLKCIRMEDFGSLDADGVKACRDGVHASDLFIGLIGMRRGWEPACDPHQRSITEMEHDWAESRQIPRFLHVSPEGFPVPGNLRESDDEHRRLLAFRKRIKSGRVVSEEKFDSPESLSSFAVENLLTQIIRVPKLTQAIQGGAGSADLTAAKLMIAADTSGVSNKAADAGVGHFAIFELARRIKPDETIDFDQAMKELAAAVETAIEVAKQGRGGNLDELVQETLRIIADKTKAGDLDGAAKAADDAFAQWQKEEERRQSDEADRRERSLQSGLALLNAGLEQDILRRDACAAAGKIRQAIELENHNSHEAKFAALLSWQDEFHARGRDKGINFDLMIAVELSQLVRTIADTPDERGAALNALGIALAALGEREGGTSRLEKAVEAFHAALAEYTQARVPLDWAGTQNNLGNTLAALGEREGGTSRLKEAIEAYRAALTQQTRERVPFSWAMTQNNLGNALQRLGERHNDALRLKEAIAAFCAALTEYTQARVPLDWAMTKNNLGNALQALGQRESGTAHLEEAIEAYRAALTEYTQARVPLDWAMTKNNLGNALQALGQRESGTAHLEEAIEVYRAALTEYTQARVPLDWAMTQNNLGNALATLGERESGTARLEQAVDAYRAALTERTRDRMPLSWAMSQNNLGIALSTLGQRESGTKHLEEAVEALRAALTERTRDRMPHDWAMTQNNLGAVLKTLGEREGGTKRLQEAIEAFRAALDVFEDAGAGYYIEGTRDNLRRAEALLAQRQQPGK